MAAEDHRERGFDRAGVLAGGVDRGPAPEQRAGREVLHLALAVDRRVGDDGDRLLEVVGEVLALGRERRQRPVVAERADRLGPVGGHLLDQFDVVALPAEAGEDAVGDLDRLLGAGVGVAGDVLALERAAGLQGAVVAGGRRRRRCGAASCRGRSAASRRGRAGSSALAARSIRTSAFSPGASGFGSETIAWTETTPGLGAEDVVVLGLDLPQRPQAERVGGEHALVGVAGDQRHRALRERAHRLVQVHVEAVQVLRQARGSPRRSAAPPSPSPRPG